ncbi:MAG: ABC transporter permease [Roseiarcus sp.]
MAEPRANAGRTARPILQVQDLQVYYGESHALQGVSLTLPSGVLSVVGRNGMGKTTLCNAIVGLLRARSGSIRFDGREIAGLEPYAIVRAGIGFVPQGRRLWPSLSVDETLRLSLRTGAGGRSWTVERVYATFPRLAERRGNGGGQLSGGEQQMLAISRALLSNPRLLVMDEPTEGLAPVIVAQVRDLLIRLSSQEDLCVLVVEQNIGVATSVSDSVAIMVNGRINRIMDAGELARDRDLQQRLLGVGRHGEPEAPAPAAAPETTDGEARVFRVARLGGEAADGAPPVYRADRLPNRWGLRRPAARPAEAAAGAAAPEGAAFAIPFAERIGRTAYVVGTFDTKSAELRFIRDRLRALNIPVRTVDLSTSGKISRADVTPMQVAALHPRGSAAVFSGDRGESVSAMAEAFGRWIARERGVGGVISAGGSGGTTLATAGMRRLPLGIPKIMVSTVASGQVGAYVGASDIAMIHAVADVQGLNFITEQVLGNAAHALAGMISAMPTAEAREARRRLARPAVGITMFGVTTPAVQAIAKRLEGDFDCLVFHATGVGGRSMEALGDSGLLAGFIDLTTTEVADMLVGGVFPADADRFGAPIRTGLPWVGSVGALDMVNFGPRETVPERFGNRRLVVHNPNVTLMRTTRDENRAIGEWIGARLNLMEGPVRLLLPEGGVSMLDAPGKPFHDPEADAALFEALEKTVRQTARRRIERVDAAINDERFVAAVVEAFLASVPRRERRA